MQMLGLQEAALVQATIDDAKRVFESNSSLRLIAKCDKLSACVKIFEHDFQSAKLLLEGSQRRLHEVRVMSPVTVTCE